VLGKKCFTSQEKNFSEDHSTGIKPLEDVAYVIKVFASQERSTKKENKKDG
jgi:hypothetical protein